MKLNFILRSGLIISIVSTLNFLIRYAFEPDPDHLTLFIFQASITVIFIIFFIRRYVFEEIEQKAFPGFIMYLLNFISIFFLSTTLNILIEYSIYNHLDTEYKYEVEEIEHQGVSDHRAKKGLPMPFKLSDEEIEYKYGFYGLFELNQYVYILNIFIVIIFYLFVALFYKIKTDT